MIEVLDTTVSEKSTNINLKENDIEFGIKTGDGIEFDLVETQCIRTINGVFISCAYDYLCIFNKMEYRNYPSKLIQNFKITQ